MYTATRTSGQRINYSTMLCTYMYIRIFLLSFHGVACILSLNLLSYNLVTANLLSFVQNKRLHFSLVEKKQCGAGLVLCTCQQLQSIIVHILMYVLCFNFQRQRPTRDNVFGAQNAKSFAPADLCIVAKGWLIQARRGLQKSPAQCV